MNGVPGSGPPFTYTRESANTLLPELRDRLLALREAYAEAAGHAESVRTTAKGNGGTRDPGAWRAAGLTVAECLTWLRDRGIILRDPEQGLIDFPSVREGRPILLCWRLGEPAVDHWHDVSSGFAGRRPL